MRDPGLANILCGNELIIAQVIDRKNNLYKSLNIIMGDVNVYDIIEAVPNESGVLEVRTIVEEGVPHKGLYYYKNMKDWTELCIKAVEVSDRCILQGLTTPKGVEPGVVAMAYEADFDPEAEFGELIQAIPEE